MNETNLSKEVLSKLDILLSNQGIQSEKINQLTDKLEKYQVQEIKNQLLTTQNELWGSDPNKSGGLKQDILKLKVDKKTLYKKIDDLIASENRRAGMIIAINFIVVALGAVATILSIIK